MQLTFPNGEHAAVPLEGEVTVGSRGARVTLPGLGLSPVHASFQSDRRGLWLRVPAGAGTFVQNTFGLSNGVAAAAFTVPEGAACATAEPTDATSAVRTKTRNQRLLDMRNPSPWWS